MTISESETAASETLAAEGAEVFAFPASFAQRRLWFLDQIASGTAVYGIPQAFHLQGALDIEVLQRGLREIVRRHESLRTTFESEEGVPLQVVTEEVAFQTDVIDLREDSASPNSTLPDATARFAEAHKRAQQLAEQPFDLEKGPLLRATIYIIADDDHVLFLNVHHIVCDGWSLALLFTELSKLYAAFSAGKPSPLPEQEIQYADYAIWQSENFQGETLEQELVFWRDYLGGELPQLGLPFDHNRPTEPSLKGRLVRFNLSAAETDAIKALAKAQKTSLYMALLTAFSIFLARISGETDILVGSPIANRDREEIREAIGFYTNTVVFRSNLAGDAANGDDNSHGGGPSFRQLLLGARDNVLSVLAHQEVPLEHVVEAVNPDRRSGENPLFQVMFAVQQAPESALSMPGVRVTGVEVHSATSKFDLLLEMQELTAGMQCFFEYATDLFEESTAQRLVEHFQRLLNALVENPDENIATVALLSDEQRQQILVDWNNTQADYPREQCLHQLFATQAAAHPDKVAVSVSGDDISYRALDERANQLAHHLQGLGVGPDDMVGLCVERSIDMVVGMLGAMKAGAAYLPLDPLFPADRIAYMLEDAGAPVLLTQSDLEDELPQHSGKVVLLDDWDTINKGPREAPDSSSTTPEHLAYMIYTSGSTGKPKGVQLPHRAVVNFLSSMAETPGISVDDKLLTVTTLSFDISVLELMLPLTSGATVIIATHDEAIDGQELLGLIKDTAATIMQATPATWQMLIEAGWEGDTPLRKLLCGGEAWPAGLARELDQRSDELWNMYGPTETCIWSTCSKVTDVEDVVIGTPIANTQTYLVDKNFQLVPPGVSGELLIGGDGLARGYHQRPELTADRFIDNPFGEGRLYRSGDRVKQRTDGTLQYLERLDNQVKVRGFRIELGEIEAVLEKHPAVKQPVVIVWDGGTGHKRLAAYIVYREGQSSTGSELRKFLRNELPDYMIPNLFVDMKTLPLTANNKVNRRALPDPLKQGGSDEREFVVPASANEKLVAGVWKEILQLPNEVGLYDNFFDLGGHSLLSAQVTYRVEKATGHRLSPRALVFQNVAQLAAELPPVAEDADVTSVEAKDAETPQTDDDAVTASKQPEPKRAPSSRAPQPRPEPEKGKGLGGWLLDKVKKRLF